MRRPVLIAETPFARGYGPRFLAPPDRAVDAATAAHYIGQAREADEDKIVGDDYLAVRSQATDDESGREGSEFLALAGLDVCRLSASTKDHVFQHLREQIEVLSDAVAAVDWEKYRHELVVEIPELEEWHEASWDSLPRGGTWAIQTQSENPAKAKAPVTKTTESPENSDPIPDYIVNAADPSIEVNSDDDRTGGRSWFPWVMVVVLLVGVYLYLSQVDRTWQQRVTERHYSVGPMRVIEKPVDRPVEKIVVQPVIPAIPESSKSDQWARFTAEYQARMGRNEVVRSAELLQTWQPHLPAWGAVEPPGMKALKDDYQKAAAGKLREWTTARTKQDFRFGDAHEGLTSFSKSVAVGTLLGATTTAELARDGRSDVRLAEDQYHYERLRSLNVNDPSQDAQLKQHIDAYLGIQEPAGKMLTHVQGLADYRQWVKSGKPTKVTVRIDWGQRAPHREHQIELTLGAKREPIVRKAMASPGASWSETFALTDLSIPADGKLPYRIKTIRSTSVVEELAEATQTKTELFLLSQGMALEAAEEPESGTKVVVEAAAGLTAPELPPWKNGLPAIPTSLSK